MAEYLVTKPGGDITEVSAKNIHQAIEDLELEDGDSVVVYRVAGGPRRVTVETETVRRVRVE